MHLEHRLTGVQLAYCPYGEESLDIFMLLSDRVARKNVGNYTGNSILLLLNNKVKSMICILTSSPVLPPVKSRVYDEVIINPFLLTNTILNTGMRI